MTSISSSAALWHSLPKAEQHRLISRFTHLQPDQLRELGIREAGWLFAWIFEQQGLVARRIEPGNEWVDLELGPEKAGKAEFARIYLGKRGTPLNAVYATLKALEGRAIIKLHLYTMGRFPPSMRHLSDQFPIAVEQQEYDDLVCRLLEAQSSYRVTLHQRRDFYLAPKEWRGGKTMPQKRGLWAQFKTWLDRLWKQHPIQEKKNAQKSSTQLGPISAPNRHPHASVKPVLGAPMVDDRRHDNAPGKRLR